MGLLSGILSAAAPIAGTFFGGPLGGAIGGAVGGLLGSSNTPSSLTATSQNKIDPRMDAMLWGKDGSSGLLNKYQSYLDQPQSPALQNYGNAAGDYLNNYGAGAMQQIQGAATNAMTGTGPALADLKGYAVGSQVQAPNQNNIDLTGSYHNLLGGGDTTALNNSMNAAVNATNAGFKTNQDNVTNSLMRNVLPSIRSNSVLAGQYGGSRQGIAEGNAISDYTNQLTNANTQLGATNSANTTAQAANAYQQGQDRALAATQGLGAQQYGVAQQNSANEMAAQMQNVNNLWDASKTNAAMTNQVNAQDKSTGLAGAGVLGGLMNQNYGTAQNANNAGINRATQVNGLLAPYLGANSSNTNSQPLYQNTAGNMLGGALMGSQMSGLLGGGTTDYNAIRNGDGISGLLRSFGGNGNAGVFNAPSSVDNMAKTIGGQNLSIPSLSMWG